MMSMIYDNNEIIIIMILLVHHNVLVRIWRSGDSIQADSYLSGVGTPPGRREALEPPDPGIPCCECMCIYIYI